MLKLPFELIIIIVEFLGIFESTNLRLVNKETNKNYISSGLLAKYIFSVFYQIMNGIDREHDKTYYYYDRYLISLRNLFKNVAKIKFTKKVCLNNWIDFDNILPFGKKYLIDFKIIDAEQRLVKVFNCQSYDKLETYWKKLEKEKEKKREKEKEEKETEDDQKFILTFLDFYDFNQDRQNYFSDSDE